MPAVWILTRIMGGRGAWFAPLVSLIVMTLAAYLYIMRNRQGENFHTKRLLLCEGFGADEGKELSISADTMLEAVGMARIAGQFCRENGIEQKKAYTLALCVEEMTALILEHGFADGRPHKVDIRILIKKSELILRIRDDCKPFNPLERYEMIKEDPDNTGKNLGIRMVVGMSSDMKYYTASGTNNLIIRV